MSLRITDAQVHVWERATTERPWDRAAAPKASHPEFPVERVLGEMDAAGVQRAILVTPAWVGERNEYCLDAARRHPERFAVMGRVALDAPGRVPLDQWRAQPGMLGLRLSFNRLGPGWLTDERAAWIWPAAASANLPVMIFAPGGTAGIRSVARRHPDLRIVVDHLGIASSARDEEIRDAVAQTIGLADLPNVAVKASALPAVVTTTYPFENLHGLVERVLEAFGRERVFWGSDLSRLRCPYSEAVRMFTEELSALSPEDLVWVMGRGVETWIGWPDADDRTRGFEARR